MDYRVLLNIIIKEPKHFITCNVIGYRSWLLENCENFLTDLTKAFDKVKVHELVVVWRNIYCIRFSKETLVNISNNQSFYWSGSNTKSGLASSFPKGKPACYLFESLFYSITSRITYCNKLIVEPIIEFYYGGCSFFLPKINRFRRKTWY